MDWFAEQLLAWYDQHGRKHLPWQQDINAYRVWVSEIMLQQTQVTTVIPYFEKFMARFPDVQALAEADLDEVLHHWTGLGYYARGRNLHKAARQVLAEHHGEMPSTVQALEALPGIGRSTAGAIAAIAAGVRAPILDGNVKRVLARFHAVEGYPGQSAVAQTLWNHADAHTPTERIADYTQAIMDLGATVCVRSNPACGDCPIAGQCTALATATIAQYPSRQPKKDKPVRKVRIFVAHDGSGACLMEQRPTDGVWGGLWTPPERPADTSPEGFIREFGLQTLERSPTHIAPVFRHTFTHFHLDIEPVYIEVAEPAQATRERDDVRWYSAGSNEPLGLSAPAVKLIASLSEFSLT
jgi:A/G-specific adenine glycosylase